MNDAGEKFLERVMDIAKTISKKNYSKDETLRLVLFSVMVMIDGSGEDTQLNYSLFDENGKGVYFDHHQFSLMWNEYKP